MQRWRAQRLLEQRRPAAPQNRQVARCHASWALILITRLHQLLILQHGILKPISLISRCLQRRPNNIELQMRYLLLLLQMIAPLPVIIGIPLLLLLSPLLLRKSMAVLRF